MIGWKEIQPTRYIELGQGRPRCVGGNSHWTGPGSIVVGGHEDGGISSTHVGHLSASRYQSFIKEVAGLSSEQRFGLKMGSIWPEAARGWVTNLRKADAMGPSGDTHNLGIMHKKLGRLVIGPEAD